MKHFIEGFLLRHRKKLRPENLLIIPEIKLLDIRVSKLASENSMLTLYFPMVTGCSIH